MKTYYKRIVFKYAYVLIALGLCIVTLYPLRVEEQCSDLLRFICYVIVVISAYNFEDNRKRIADVFDNPWKILILIIAWVYFSLSVTGIYLFDAPKVTYTENIPHLLYFAATLVWVLAVLLQAVSMILQPYECLKSEQNLTVVQRLLVVLAIIIPSIVVLIAFNPAITSTDSEQIISQAHLLWSDERYLFDVEQAPYLWSKDHAVLDWHSPFYTFVVSVILSVTDNISMIVIIQDVFFAVVFEEILNYLYTKGIRLRTLIFVYLFCVLSISNLLQLATIWKDVPFTISIIWLTFLLIKFSADRGCSKRWYVCLYFSVVFTALFRQNGILPALAVIVLLIVFTKFSKRMVITSGAILLSIFLVKGPLYSYMGVVHVPQMKYFALSNDIMNSYFKGETPSSDEMELISKIVGDQQDEYEYETYYVYFNKDEPSNYSIPQFILMYLKSLVKHPRYMIKAVLERSSPLYSIFKSRQEHSIRIAYAGEMHDMDKSWYGYRKNNALTKILDTVNMAIRTNSLLYVIFWRVGLYNLLIVILFVVCVATKRKCRIRLLVPFVPVVMNNIALVIGAGWGGNYRYFYSSVIISVILLFYVRALIPLESEIAGKISEI